ncbi:MAG: trypsin-like peptidase domain-containing protein [Methanotrichaceae archaeon]|nr:trypsin-like peptidase domain-containing protein [Methanotrichaceae archaeon]
MKILDREVFAVSLIKFRKHDATLEDSASGFFYEDLNKLFFVTNRHVVVDEEEDFFPDSLELNLHTDQEDLSRSKKYTISLYEGDMRLWLEYPRDGKGIDVVALPVDKDEIDSEFHVEAFSKKDLLSPRRYISIGDDLLVVGFPLGIRDTKHKTPIVRSAIIASVYPLPFDGKPYFLIDSFLHDGTSGSPVLLKPSDVIRDVNGRARLVHDKTASFKRELIGVNSGAFIPTNWEPCDMEQIREDGCPRMGLNKVWFASLIPEIINGKGL